MADNLPVRRGEDGMWESRRGLVMFLVWVEYHLCKSVNHQQSYGVNAPWGQALHRGQPPLPCPCPWPCPWPLFKGGHGVGVSVSIRIDIHVQVMVRVVCDPVLGGIFIEINRLCLALEYFVEREHCVLVGIRFGHHHIAPASPSPQLCFGIHQLSCLCWCLVNW